MANKNRDGAQDNFQKAIAATQDPKVVGWSHVYLGRILDMKEDREAALQQYRAALNSGGGLPEIKAAAERGLQQAYEPPAKPQPMGSCKVARHTRDLGARRYRATRLSTDLTQRNTG